MYGRDPINCDYAAQYKNETVMCKTRTSNNMASMRPSKQLLQDFDCFFVFWGLAAPSFIFAPSCCSK